MSEESSTRTPSDPSSSIRLRLAVGVPVALALVALAAGVGAVEVLHLMEPALEENPPARLWAIGIVVVFSLLIGGLGLLFVRMLQAPLEEVIEELEKRVDPSSSPSAPGGARGSERAGLERAATGGPADELALARRTIGEYLRRLDEYRIDAGLLEEIEEALIVLDEEGTVVHANERARRLFAAEGEELRGRPFEDVLGEPPSNLALRSLTRRCVEELEGWAGGERRTTVSEELVVERPDGSTSAMRARGHVSGRGFGVARRGASGGDGREPSLLLALEPVDEREEASLRRERRDRLAALGTLVSEVAHEVRNPLGSLRGLTELVAGRLPEEDPAREHLAEISDRIQGVTRYLDEILDYSQPRTLEPEEVELEELLRRARSSVEDEAREAEAEVAVGLDRGAPETLRADPDRVVQVLVNLLRNALEAVEEGGEVSLEAGPAAAADVPGPPAVELRVHNSGSYVAPERREEIFRPFVSTREGGTGLGLPISRYLVRLHGGTLSLESDREAGTTFIVSLPVTEAGDGDAEAGAGDGHGRPENPEEAPS